MGVLKNYYEKAKTFLVEKLVNPFKQNINQPAFLAMSVAVGTFCTLLPILMFQQYLCIFLWIISKKFKALAFSLIIGLAITVITNPATMPFVLYFYYVVGILFTGDKAIEWTPFIDRIKTIIDAQHQSVIEALKNSFGFVIDEVGLPILIGCLVCVVVLTPLSYLLTYFIAKSIKSKKI